MKVRLLKDLPTCQAGTIGVKEGSQIVFDKNTRNPYFFEVGEIEHKADWFEFINEIEWKVEALGSNAIRIHQNIAGSLLRFDVLKIEHHFKLIESIPKIVRLLKEVADDPANNNKWSQADDLLKSIES